MSKPLSFYQRIFHPTSTEQQAAFLEQLFERDSNIRKQFEQFIANWEETSGDKPPIVSFVDLEELAAEIREELSDLSFDMESVYNYFEEGDRSYVPRYDAAYEGAENMLRKEGFEPYTKQAKQFLEKDNLWDGTKVLLAMYEGHNGVYEPGYDEENLMEDYNFSCLDIFKEQMQYLLSYYKGKEARRGCEVLDLLIERLLFWRENYNESLYENEYTDENVVYDLSVFEPLFLAILDNATTAAHLKDLLLKHNLKDKDTSKVFLKIATLDTNENDWVETAETFAKDDVNIMRQLLAHYDKEGKEQDLYRIAKKAFSHFSYQMYRDVLARIESEKDQGFYVEVLAYTTSTDRSIEHYRLLRRYLQGVSKDNFIAQQIKWMDFYVAILAEEKQYKEILTILQKHPAHADTWNSREGNFKTIASHVMNEYPLETFQLLKKAIDEALKNGRGRGVYSTVTAWMALMLRIKGNEAKAQKYIENIVKEFSNFSALKDEMRKGGVL